MLKSNLIFSIVVLIACISAVLISCCFLYLTFNPFNAVRIVSVIFLPKRSNSTCHSSMGFMLIDTLDPRLILISKGISLCT